jgi:amidophosphoribosyltransferase
MCGVVGIMGTPDAAREAFLALTTLQHRGQDAAGILSYDESGFHRVKNIGLVESVFTRENTATLTGNLAIAHARYATVGRGDIGEVQPFVINYPFGLGIVHNGNVVNGAELAKELKQRSRRHLLTRSDTEILLNLLADELAKPTLASSELKFEQICSAVGEVCKRANGSFSVVTLVADHGLVAFRDPYGIRPLVYGKKQRRRDTEKEGSLPTFEAHMFASESVALDFCNYEFVRNLEPGEVMYIDMEGKVHSRVIDSRARRHCMFEWVYFASPESNIDQVPVYGARLEFGKQLANRVRKELAARGLSADLVVPIPETSRIAAITLAEELGVPYREVLIKNRYIKRTFILDSQDKRQKAVNLKLSPVKSEIAGKRVLLVDDSIVRGTTSKKIIELVRKAGAQKVYIVSTCPPIRKPCFYGIDFPSEGELIAGELTHEQIEKELQADAVIYQTLEGLEAAITDAERPIAGQKAFGFKPCMACLDGKYPTDIGLAGKNFTATRAAERKGKEAP